MPPLPARAAWPPAPASPLDEDPPEQPATVSPTTINSATTSAIARRRDVTAAAMALIVDNLSFDESSSARSSTDLGDC